MRKHSVLALVLLQLTFGELSGSDFSKCSAEEMAGSYMDVAIEMIKKAKDNYPKYSTKPLDCEDLLKSKHYESKEYQIWPKSRVLNGKPIDVYCDMVTDGGGWTVFQRRGNFSRAVDYFYQDWTAYKQGFGNINEDFWLGNDNIFALSNQKSYSIRFDLKDVEGNEAYATYDAFWIDDEDHNYTLHIKGYKGNAGDSITRVNGQEFSSKDRDNDVEPTKSCSQMYKGGWWYSACHSANLNGLYLRGKHESYADGVVWREWKGYHESMDTTEIKIRSKDFQKVELVQLKTPKIRNFPKDKQNLSAVPSLEDSTKDDILSKTPQ